MIFDFLNPSSNTPKLMGSSEDVCGAVFVLYLLRQRFDLFPLQGTPCFRYSSTTWHLIVFSIGAILSDPV